MEEYLFSQRLSLFPLSTGLEQINEHSQLSIAGCDLKHLAEHFGTPLYVFDQATLDDSVQQYRQALQAFYPGRSGLTYAGKAFLCLAIAQWATNQSLVIDCTGSGELAIASMAKTPKAQILAHGVNKSQEDLIAAMHLAGTIVVDNLHELDRLISINEELQGVCPTIWLRLRPGVAAETHVFTQTGQVDSKFGMSADEIFSAVESCQKAGLPLKGLHFHQGSHFHNLAPLNPAFEFTFDLLNDIRLRNGWFPDLFCPGGGWGVPYHEDDLPHPSIADYVQHISNCVIANCKKRKLPLPILQLEPGRSLVARAGVAIYQLGAVKYTPSQRWLLLDGGMTDNIRPALYGARYTALPIIDPHRLPHSPASLAGPFCESGDVLIRDLPMPDIHSGEYIAVPVSGAYNLSMSSNYNGSRRPAVLWLSNGSARLIQRRENLTALYDRDVLLGNDYE